MRESWEEILPLWREGLSQIPGLLLAWYDQNARVLPWRSNPLPYRVWVSEIMLQQTRVETVGPYYERFLAALPTIQDLAEVSEDKLLKLWEGLGYYNRARNLQRAAVQVMERFGGELPGDFEALSSLPGIGRYTAGAIASIAFGLPVPAVDGNVLRVVSRVLCSELDIAKEAVKRAMGEALTAILPKDRVGDFNQALMELGAMVCLPGGALRCECCPLSAVCQGYGQGKAEALPVKAPKKPPKEEERTVAILLLGERVALRRRTHTGLLAGMWELPSWKGMFSPDLLTQVLTSEGIRIKGLRPLPPAQHVFTHRIWRMTGYSAESAGESLPSGWVWADLEQLRETYALPGAFSSYARLLPELIRRKI